MSSLSGQLESKPASLLDVGPIGSHSLRRRESTSLSGAHWEADREAVVNVGTEALQSRHIGWHLVFEHVVSPKDSLQPKESLTNM